MLAWQQQSFGPLSMSMTSPILVANGRFLYVTAGFRKDTKAYMTEVLRLNLSPPDVAEWQAQVMHGVQSETLHLGAAHCVLGPRLFLHGGHASPGDVMHCFNFHVGVWSTISLAVSLPLSSHSMVAHDGLLYLFGGLDSSGTPCNHMVVFRGDSRKMERIDCGAPLALIEHRAWTYRDSMYVFGGVTSARKYSGSLLCYSFTTRLWDVLPCPVPPRSRHSVSVLRHLVVVVGGRNSDTYFNDVHLFEMNSNTWRTVSVGGQPLAPVFDHGAAFVGHKLVVHGGKTMGNSYCEPLVCSLELEAFTRAALDSPPPPLRSSSASSPHHGADVLTSVPRDILCLILRYCDAASLCRLSCCSVAALLLAQDNACWRRICRASPSAASLCAVNDNDKVPGSWKRVYLRSRRLSYQPRAVKQEPLLAQVMQRLFGAKPEYRVLLQGLDAGGKTTLLYQYKLGEVVTTMPTSGFHVESFEYRRVRFTVWDVGGQDKIRPLWRHYHANTCGIIFVVDSVDAERLPLAREALSRHLLASGELQWVPLLVLANKRDLPRAMSLQEITEGLALYGVTDRQWAVRATCVTSADGIWEGLEWLADSIRQAKLNRP